MNRHRLLMALGAALMVSTLFVAIRGYVARAATQNVTVADFSFTDATSGTSTTTITAGDTVIWAWAGAAQHTVTSDSGTELGSGAPQLTGTYSHLFSTPGTFHYHCEVHPTQMMGTVVVQAAAAPTSTSTALAATSTAVTPTVTPQSTGTPISTDTPAPARTPAATPGAGASPAAPPPPAAGTGAASQFPRTGTGEDPGVTPVRAAIVLALLGGAALSGALVARRP